SYAATDTTLPSVQARPAGNSRNPSQEVSSALLPALATQRISDPRAEPTNGRNTLPSHLFVPGSADPRPNDMLTTSIPEIWLLTMRSMARAINEPSKSLSPGLQAPRSTLIVNATAGRMPLTTPLLPEPLFAAPMIPV